jgi:hypothetical protein
MSHFIYCYADCQSRYAECVDKLSSVLPSVVMLSIIMLSVIMLSAILLSVDILSVILLSVVMLNVVMLNVVAPRVDSVVLNLIANFNPALKCCQFNKP